MVKVEYEGNTVDVDEATGFVIGREGDLPMGDNPYLHRQFLEVAYEHGFWWLSNVGQTLSATVYDPSSSLQAWLRPGGRIPLVFGRIDVLFTAGPLSYSVAIIIDDPLWRDNPEIVPLPLRNSSLNSSTTIGACTWTAAQRLAIVALAEPMLLRDTLQGVAHIPSNVEAAHRLGWTVKRFEKKIDNICAKLDELGVEGVRGGLQAHASARRSRLVEWAVSTGLVTSVDLVLLRDAASVSDDDDV